MKAFRRTTTFAARKNSGFTLIELLVVIAIIAILAAILFPVFAQAREKARQTSCLSNLKQLNLGMMMYAQDYDETFPVWHWGESNVNGTGGPAGSQDNATSLWAFAIFPYVKNQQVYVCPSDTRKLSIKDDGWFSANPKGVPTGMSMTMPISYGMNEYMHNEKPSVAAMGSPADIFVLADSATHLSGYGGIGDATQFTARIGAPKGDGCFFANGGTGDYYSGSMPVANVTGKMDVCTYHSGGNNIGFADGHVKYRKLKTITGALLKPADY